MNRITGIGSLFVLISMVILDLNQNADNEQYRVKVENLRTERDLLQRELEECKLSYNDMLDIALDCCNDTIYMYDQDR